MTRSAGAGALTGVRVLDLTRVLGGPYCTQILADHGADVIKVEPPQGDETRNWGPPFVDGSAAYFHGVNRNKRGIALDITQQQGRELILRLLESTDVLVDNFKAGSLEKWGLGYADVLSRRFPRLVHASITGFGVDGPLGGFPGYDFMVQAWSGLVSVNGSPDSGPLRIGVAVVDLATGMNAVIGILLALRERDASGLGQHIDLALYDCALALLHPHTANWFASDNIPGLTGNSHPSLAPYGMFKVKDGHLITGAGNDGQFRKLCELIGAPALATDPRFVANSDRLANAAALSAELERALAPQQAVPMAMKLMRAGVPAGAVQNTAQAMTHPHTLHRKMNVEVPGYRGAGVPVKLSRTPGAVRHRPPKFSEHTDAVLAAAGLTERQIAQLRAAGVIVDRPKPV